MGPGPWRRRGATASTRGLRIVGARDRRRWNTANRQALSELIRDIALTVGGSRSTNAIAPEETLAAIAGAHALIDASVDDDLRQASLEAVSPPDVPVLTSKPSGCCGCSRRSELSPRLRAGRPPRSLRSESATSPSSGRRA